MGEIAEAGTAEALRHGDAEQSLGTQGRPQGARKLVAAIDGIGQRGDLLGCEAPHLAPDLLELGTKAKIAVGAVEGAHGLASPWTRSYDCPTNRQSWQVPHASDRDPGEPAVGGVPQQR